MADRTEIDYSQWYADATSTYQDLVWAKDKIFSEDLVTINRGENRIYFSNCQFKKVHVLSGREVKFLEDCECDEIHLTNGNAVQLFQHFRSRVKSNLYIVASNFEITLDNSNIEQLHLFPNFGKFERFTANLCTFETLVLERFVAHEVESVRFDLCIVNRRMEITHSIIENVGFNGLNLTRAQLTVSNSTLLKANYYSISWPKTFKVDESLVELVDLQGNKTELRKLDENDVDKIMEIYRQLKVISISGYNKFAAVKFQRNEIRMLHKKLDLQRVKRETSSTRWEMFGDLLILWLNKTVTNYGESLWRPTIILLVCGLAFFWLNMGELGIVFPKSLDNIDYNVTIRAVGYYFNFINPVHSDTVESITGNTVRLFGISDFLIRLASGFLIYHIVRATRKFSFSI